MQPSGYNGQRGGGHPLVAEYDYPAIRDEFCNQLKQAAQGEITSLPFVCNRLPESPLVRTGEAFQAFVIGGTNGEMATVRPEKNGITVLEYEAHPELDKFKTADELFRFIDAHLHDATRVLGLNFGFALAPVNGAKGKLDGIMIGDDTKDHLFQGLIGQKVGETIERHVRVTQGRELTVSMANDSVCLAAAAAALSPSRETLMAGIVGTGYNMAFFLDERTIVNVQACDFAYVPSAAESAEGGGTIQPYRTAVSGGELYKRYNALVGACALPTTVRSGTELAAVAIADEGQAGDIARALFKRSAALVAAQFAGLYNFKERPATLTAIMQGGLFWNGPGYRDMVAAALGDLGVPKGSIAFEKLEHADILGAATLVTAGIQ